MHTRSDTAVALGSTTSPEEWDALVTGNGGCFFQRHHWLTTTADVLGLDFHGLTVYADGQPVGVAPMLVKRIGPVRTVNWVPFPYTGPLVPTTLLPHVLPLLTNWERKNRAIRSQHVFMSTVDQVPTLDRTFVVDFRGQTEDSLLQRVEPKRRAKIRRAAARAVVRPSTHEEIRDLLPAWSKATFTAQGLPAPYPTAGYDTVWTRFADSPDARFSTALLDGTPVCAQVSFAGAPRAVAWVMANAGTPQASLAQPLLYWDTITWAFNQGCAEFDLVGAPTEGVARYKRDWGAREVRYSVLQRQSAIYRVLRQRSAAP